MEGIVNGEIKLIGATTCDDPKCRQCINEEIKGISIVETTREERTFLSDRIEIGNHKQLLEENEKMREELEDFREQKAKRSKLYELQSKAMSDTFQNISQNDAYKQGLGKTIKLGKWKVSEYLLKTYARTIRGMLDEMSPLNINKNPMLGMKLFQKRVEFHKEIFKSVKVPYYQDVHALNHKRQYKESKKLYDLIEEWIAENYPEIEKKSRYDIDKINENYVESNTDDVYFDHAKGTLKKDYGA